MKTEIHNFKNVSSGEVKYMNYGSLNNGSGFCHSDIVGIYGQNGSGKTALVEALDALKHILSGEELPYKIFSGLITGNKDTRIVSLFYLSKGDDEYKVQYEVKLTADVSAEKINLAEEKIVYWRKGSLWKSERDLTFSNPYYDNDDILTHQNLAIQSRHMSAFKDIPFLGSMQTLAAVSAQGHISVFFSKRVQKALGDLENKNSDEVKHFTNIIKWLMRFSEVDFHVIKVNQLGDINGNECIPLNMHYENETSIIQGCLPLFINGQGELPEDLLSLFKNTIEAINIAIKAIIPNLQIELKEKARLEKNDGRKWIQIELYSCRDGKRFLTRYESEGIKRIISLLSALISVYNNPAVCLVVDELDSGIFEYLLGELLGMMQEEMRGQLIFTSHNLRALEKLDTQSIVCSTTNPDNRYIRLTGINKNNNRRDFYIRAIAIGGQKEELYDEKDLQAMSYAFRKAGKKTTEKIELPFTEEIRSKMERSSEVSEQGQKEAK